jgi:hypothetical protein
MFGPCAECTGNSHGGMVERSQEGMRMHGEYIVSHNKSIFFRVSGMLDQGDMTCGG